MNALVTMLVDFGFAVILIVLVIGLVVHALYDYYIRKAPIWRE